MSMLGIKWKLHGNGKSIKPGHVVAPDERLAFSAFQLDRERPAGFD